MYFKLSGVNVSEHRLGGVFHISRIGSTGKYRIKPLSLFGYVQGGCQRIAPVAVERNLALGL